MKTDGKIYKYVVPERIDILENLQIRVTQPKYLNDLFDLSISFKKIIPDELYNQYFHPKVIGLMKYIKENFQVPGKNLTFEEFLEIQGLKITDIEKNIRDSFTKKNLDAINQLNEVVNKEFGVLCFTESPDNVPMWAHYADLYRGFIIIFNSNHPIFNKSMVDDKDAGYLDKVIYVKEKEGFESVKELYDNTKKIFFEKHESWGYENEWRMILPLDLATTKKYPDIFLISFPSDLIVGVIFGFYSSPKLIEHMQDLKKDKFTNLELYQAVPNLENYKMDIVELDK